LHFVPKFQSKQPIPKNISNRTRLDDGISHTPLSKIHAPDRAPANSSEKRAELLKARPSNDRILTLCLCRSMRIVAGIVSNDAANAQYASRSDSLDQLHITMIAFAQQSPSSNRRHFISKANKVGRHTYRCSCTQLRRDDRQIASKCKSAS